MATALRLRGTESHRNFPRVAVSSDERDFQAGLSTDALLAMIRDGSYRAKLTDFLLRGNPKNPRIGTEAGAGPERMGAFRQLFRKELTPSDVGKLNRLVIPKKHAVRRRPGPTLRCVIPVGVPKHMLAGWLRRLGIVSPLV